MSELLMLLSDALCTSAVKIIIDNGHKALLAKTLVELNSLEYELIKTIDESLAAQLKEEETAGSPLSITEY